MQRLALPMGRRVSPFVIAWIPCSGVGKFRLAERDQMCRVQAFRIEGARMLLVSLLVAFHSTALAEEQRIQAKVGSFWNYESTDEVKQAKSIIESALTEVNGDERVMRTNVRGVNPTASVYDKNWNAVELGAYKYQPNNGQGVPEPLQIGSKSKINATFSVQSATGWSDPRPLSIEAEIVSTEIMSTKAGKFETYRIEITSTLHGWPTQPLSVNELKMVGWFSPKIDHFVRVQLESRTDGRLVSKVSSELIEYQIK
jgi:hypothetical protein